MTKWLVTSAMAGVLAVLSVAAASTAVSAQFGERNRPRKAGSPIKRTRDGKPDLRGHWTPTTGATYFIEEHDAGFGIRAGKSLIVDPPDGKIPYQPWAAKERDRRSLAENSYEDPEGKCIMSGIPRIMNFAFELDYVPGALLFNSDYVHHYRYIPLDGRPHLPNKIRLYMGDPVGHWEGDTLVVDTTNFSGKTWIELGGDFNSGEEHITERFETVDGDTLNWRARIDDPKVYTRPMTVVYGPFYRDDVQEDIEDSCHEGNTEIAHTTALGKAAKAKALEGQK
jgi:hypothetical protein